MGGGGANMDMDSLNKSLGPSSVYLLFALLLLLPTSLQSLRCKTWPTIPSCDILDFCLSQSQSSDCFISHSMVIITLLRPWIKADL